MDFESLKQARQVILTQSQKLWKLKLSPEDQSNKNKYQDDRLVET